MKIIAATALAVLYACAAIAAPWSLKSLGEHVEKTNVLLNGTCSGTVIDADRGLILTAHHCLKDRQSVVFRVYEGVDVLHETTTPAEVVAEDAANDLALLQVGIRLPFTWEATLYEGDVPLGADVWLVGSPEAYNNSVSKGILSSKHDKLGPTDYINAHIWVTDARAIGGNSGGAAYVDGRLIGVLSGGYFQDLFPVGRVPLGINYIIPLPTVSAFLAEYDAGA